MFNKYAVKIPRIPISTPGEVAELGASLAKLLPFALIGTAAYEGLDLVGDYLRSIWKPSWEIQGKARAYSKYDDAMKFIKAKELGYRMQYDMPYDVVTRTVVPAFTNFGLNAVRNAVSGAKAQANFERLYQNFPALQHMPKEQAHLAYNQLAAVAPQIAAEAPGALTYYMNNAITNGPFYLGDITSLPKANNYLQGWQRYV